MSVDLQNSRLITAILPRGVARGVADRLHRELGIFTANISHARGRGVSATHRTTVAPGTEKEILTVVIDEPAADAVFQFIFHAAEIDRPHGGIVYMSTTIHSIPFLLPDVPEEV